MNTNTLTAVATTIAGFDGTIFTVGQLVTETGISETTVRKVVAQLVADGKVAKAEGPRGSFIVVAPKAKKAAAKKDPKTGKKVYKKNPHPIRYIRKSRATKAEYTVQQLDELAAADPFAHRALVEAALGSDVEEFENENKWITVCLTHNNHVGSEFIVDAWHKATHPAFCPSCKKAMTPEQIAAAKVLPSTKRKADKAAA